MKIYSGQSISEVEEVELAQNVCYELTNKLFNEGRTLYADNFYMSYELALQFLNLKTYSVGELYDTIKKSIPKDVIDYPLKKGETVSLEDNNGIVSKGKMFSTKYAHYGTQFEFIYSSPLGHKIETGVEYNKRKCGIDRSDQMISYATTLRKDQ